MNNPDLSILCITRNEPHAEHFGRQLADLAKIANAELVLCVDDGQLPTWVCEVADRCECVKSKGYIESVLDIALGFCKGKYVLRLDDDESASPELVSWLARGNYRQCDHWCFPRANLWGDEKHFVMNDPLWPDYQTRLSTWEMSGGRAVVHIGSPFGAGRPANAAILHYKFLIRDREARREVADRYEEFSKGFGYSKTYKPFQFPEDCFEHLQVGEL